MAEQTLLYIDDDPMCWHLMEAMARRYAPADWTLTAVESIEDAAPVLRTQPVQVVLLDLNLQTTSGTSGLESLRRLRELIQTAVPARAADIPVVILTGGDASLQPQTMALGAVGFVTKLRMVDDPPGFFQFLEQTLGQQGQLEGLDADG